MMRPDREFLPHVAAFSEIDAEHVIHAAFQRKRGLADDFSLTLGDAVQDTPDPVLILRGLVGGGEERREAGNGSVRVGKQDAVAEGGGAGIGGGNAEVFGFR